MNDYTMDAYMPPAPGLRNGTLLVTRAGTCDLCSSGWGRNGSRADHESCFQIFDKLSGTRRLRLIPVGS